MLCIYKYYNSREDKVCWTPQSRSLYRRRQIELLGKTAWVIIVIIIPVIIVIIGIVKIVIITIVMVIIIFCLITIATAIIAIMDIFPVKASCLVSLLQNKNSTKHYLQILFLYLLIAFFPFTSFHK